MAGCVYGRGAYCADSRLGCGERADYDTTRYRSGDEPPFALRTAYPDSSNSPREKLEMRSLLPSIEPQDQDAVTALFQWTDVAIGTKRLHANNPVWAK
jgi:hypothetical protein